MCTTSSATRSGRALVLLAVAAALATAACGPAGTTADAASPDTVAAGSLGDATAVSSAASGPGSEPNEPAEPNVNEPGPTALAMSFPGTAKAYAEAVIKAWKLGQIGALGSLSTPEVQEQLLEIPQPLDDAWTYLRCDGTAGSSYCIFANADGDELTLRISHSLLGQAHAAIEVRLDQTEYPADGVAYVKEFVAAWQIGNTARMLQLSKPGVVDKLGSAPLHPSYPEPDCCGGGLLQVTVVWTGSSGVVFDVGTTLLGGPHAIVDSAPGELGFTL